MNTALMVANTIIIKSLRENKSITPMKLQKLLYMVYACYLAKTNIPLFAERFEAWQYGPVISNVYNEFKQYGNSSIDMPYLSKGDNAHYTLEKGVFGSCLQEVWSKYSDFTGIALSKITHEDNSAWNKKSLGQFLDDKDIMNDGKKWFS